MGKSTVSTGPLTSSQTVSHYHFGYIPQNPMEKQHFPMVFPWFSLGFPVVPCFFPGSWWVFPPHREASWMDLKTCSSCTSHCDLGPFYGARNGWIYCSIDMYRYIDEPVHNMYKHLICDIYVYGF